MAKKKAPKRRSKDHAERRRRLAAKQSRDDAASIRDIGELPPVKDKTRREACLESLELFNRTYFPKRYTLPFSEDHKDALQIMQRVCMKGESHAMAMFRSGGKTTLCETLAIFSALGAHHLYIALIGASAQNADAMTLSIQMELAENDLLLEDFPEVCYPIRCLEGVTLRCRGQTHKGRLTHISWTKGMIVLPTIEGSASSGAAIQSKGIEGGIRGFKRTLRGGKQIRPTLAIVDDPQTDQSALSAPDCEYRLRVIKRAIRRLAGPGKATAVVVPGTVIAHGDVMHTLLDREKNPQFQGRVYKMVYAFPRHMELWENEYDQRRRSDLILGDSTRTEYYRRNYEMMSEGAKVAWPEMYDRESGQIDGLQFAMDLFLEDRGAFFAECQNDPMVDTQGQVDVVSAEKMVTLVNDLPVGTTPDSADILVTYIDVQDQLLYFVSCAFDRANFTASIVNYGTFPQQSSRYFTLRTARKTLGETFKAGREGRIFSGLQSLTDYLKKPLTKQNGDPVYHHVIGIDSRWEKNTVFSFCRQSDIASKLLPCQGSYVGASSEPLQARRLKKGETRGPFWVWQVDPASRLRKLYIDSNAAKAFAHSRLLQVDGDAGNLRLFGRAGGTKIDYSAHQMIADHVCKSELAVRTTGRGRECVEFKTLPGSPDNHLLDCLAGCMALASWSGARLQTETRKVMKRRRGKRAAKAL